MSQSSNQQEEESFHQQTGPKFKEEISKVLYLDYGFVRVETWALRKVPGKFLNVVLEKDGDHLDRQCQKRRSIYIQSKRTGISYIQ
jgi:hypothetical protein